MRESQAHLEAVTAWLRVTELSIELMHRNGWAGNTQAVSLALDKARIAFDRFEESWKKEMVE